MRNFDQFLLLLLFYLTPCVSSYAQSSSVQRYTEKLDSIVAPDSKEIYEYNDRGYLIKKTTYSFDEYKHDYELSSAIEYERNEQGQEIKQSSWFRNSEGEMVLSSTLLYDELGRTIEYTLYNAGIVLSCSKYLYDGDVHTNVRYYYSNNICERMEISVYDYSKGSFPIKEEFIDYDSKGQVNTWSKYERTYDTKGNEIKYSSCQWQDNTWIVTYETIKDYDASGNMTRESHYSLNNGVLCLYWREEYDSNGNITRTAWYDASNGDLLLSQENIYEYFGNIQTKKTHNDYKYSGQSYVIRYDNKGYLLEDRDRICDMTYNENAEPTECIVYSKNVSVNGARAIDGKLVFSQDQEGNYIVMVYGHASTTYKDYWTERAKHIIKTNDDGYVEEVKVYGCNGANKFDPVTGLYGGKWNLERERVYHDDFSSSNLTIASYLSDYDSTLYQHSEDTDHSNCLNGVNGVGKCFCYDAKGNMTYCWSRGTYQNNYGGTPQSHKSGSTIYTYDYNQYEEVVSSKKEKIIDGKLTVVSEVVTNEFYEDFTPVVQSTYKDGIQTKKTIYTYDWDVDENTISGFSERHKLLSKEIIDENNNSLFTHYYYSNIGAATDIESVSSYNGNQAVIYDVTGKQRNAIQKGLNIVNEGGKTRKMVVR